MTKWLGAHSEKFYSLLRVVAGLLYACHGAQKLFGAFGGKVMTGVPLMLAAGVIELGCGIMIALGLFTGFAAFVASGEMAVGYFKEHFPGGFWPIENKGELAVVYCFLFLFIASHGPGRWALGKSRT